MRLNGVVQVTKTVIEQAKARVVWTANPKTQRFIRIRLFEINQDRGVAEACDRRDGNGTARSRWNSKQSRRGGQ
jgi:hypothetical protein